MLAHECRPSRRLCRCFLGGGGRRLRRCHGRLRRLLLRGRARRRGFGVGEDGFALALELRREGAASLRRPKAAQRRNHRERASGDHLRRGECQRVALEAQRRQPRRRGERGGRGAQEIVGEVEGGEGAGACGEAAWRLVDHVAA